MNLYELYLQSRKKYGETIRQRLAVCEIAAMTLYDATSLSSARIDNDVVSFTNCMTPELITKIACSKDKRKIMIECNDKLAYIIYWHPVTPGAEIREVKDLEWLDFEVVEEYLLDFDDLPLRSIFDVAAVIHRVGRRQHRR